MAAINIRTNFNIYLFEAQIALLNIKKIVIFPKYVDYINIFLPDFAIRLFKYTSIINYQLTWYMTFQVVC